MKSIFLFLLLLVYSISFGQTTDRIRFNYDDAGNQIKREICFCGRKSKDTDYKNIENITDADLIQDSSYQQISYYPNPVSEELYVKWKEIEGQDMKTIELYDLTGKRINLFPNQSAIDNTIISFSNHPSGIYNLIFVFNTGERKSLKIVKR